MSGKTWDRGLRERDEGKSWQTRRSIDRRRAEVELYDSRTLHRDALARSAVLVDRLMPALPPAALVPFLNDYLPGRIRHAFRHPKILVVSIQLAVLLQQLARRPAPSPRRPPPGTQPERSRSSRQGGR